MRDDLRPDRFLLQAARSCAADCLSLRPSDSVKTASKTCGQQAVKAHQALDQGGQRGRLILTPTVFRVIHRGRKWAAYRAPGPHRLRRVVRQGNTPPLARDRLRRSFDVPSRTAEFFQKADAVQIAGIANSSIGGKATEPHK
jgi:hypothetical protein